MEWEWWLNDGNPVKLPVGMDPVKEGKVPVKDGCVKLES